MAVKTKEYHEWRLNMPPKISAFIKIAVMAAIVVCWVAGCGKSVPEIPNTLTDKRDGKVYRTATIGKQIWMAENLNYKPKSGNSWCYDDNCAKYADSAKYGRLYDWNTAQKVCPSGWKLPSYQEWQTLIDYVGGKKEAGRKLKAKNGWNNQCSRLSDCMFSGLYDIIVDGNGTDDFGFSALPGSQRCYDGSHVDVIVGEGGDWWTATNDDRVGANSYYGGDAYYRNMHYSYDGVGGGTAVKGYGFSVRCVQNK